MKKTRFGFWRVVMLILVVLVVLAGGFMVFVAVSSSSAQGEVEKTRQQLRKQGFKTDLAEFNFSVPSSERGFEMCVERLQSARRMGFQTSPRGSVQVTLMRRAGPDAAIVSWKEDSVPAGDATYSWPVFAASQELNDPDFVEARSAAFSQPIRFDLEAKQGISMLLRHLPEMRLISQACGSAMVVDLHNKDRAAAWTNLVAATRLVTAWEPEPADVSQAVRFTLVPMTFQETWEALQAGGWTEEELATLQGDWESADFFKNLPETMAFKRAGAVDGCERLRKDNSAAMSSFGIGTMLKEMIKEIVRSPRGSPRMIREYWSLWRYMNEGVYDDEKSLLLFYRDREVEMRNAVKAPSWQAMKSMPGVTTQPAFTSKYGVMSVASMLNVRQVGLSMVNRGGGSLGRAAQAESYRRLIITAIALERFRGRHGHFPAGLDELAPEFLKQPAVDFMDGQPLRYRLGVDERFVLYSTGLDGVDDGGVIAKPANPMRSNSGVMFGTQESGDMVWPRVATSNEMVVLRETELQERRQEAEFRQRTDSEEYWNRTATRQVRADSSFVSPEAEINQNSFNGRWVSDILRNENLAGTNTLNEMLTLHPFITGGEGETITFEAPINYDALTNVGGLSLLIDLNKGDALDEGEGAAAQVEISRATNGNCLLAWRTIFETLGRHTLQMGLILENGNWRKVVAGPITVMEVTNLCQFSESSANFDSATGAWLFGKLPEPKANYSVEIFSPEGKRVKTISGNTSNGEIVVYWDLLGDDGKKLADQTFSTVFHITLPQSGRTQTLKGP